MGKIDYGQVAKSYARAREDIPASLMESFYIRGISLEGKKIADIGCGTGSLTRKFALRKANIVGIDYSPEMLDQAKALNQLKNFQIPYYQGTSEDTGLEADQYDIVTVMRAWHWFDREKAMQEIKRILKAKGTLIVIDSGFLTESDVVRKTLGVISKYVEGGLKPAGSKAEAKQRINGFPVEWFEEWQQNGFELRDLYRLKYQVEFTKEKWIERIESVSWMTKLSKEVRETALLELSISLLEDEPFTIPHDCNICILQLKE